MSQFVMWFDSSETGAPVLNNANGSMIAVLDACLVTGFNNKAVQSINVAAGVAAVANPLINITLQGRHDSYPKRRGMTRVPEMLAMGIEVAFGQDCVMDPWYSLGSGDMLEVAHMGLHVAQMTGQAAMRQCFAAVTENPARILGLQNYGIAPGCNADLVILDATNVIDAIRLRATRTYVLRAGKVISRSPLAHASLTLPTLNAGEMRSVQVDYRLSVAP